MIPIFTPLFEGNEREYLLDCIDTAWISSQGRYIPEFESAFAARHGLPHGVATSNCTTALHLALVAMDIGPGDEVLCPDLTFIAPANMIRLAGAAPVLVDIDPETWTIDPQKIEAHLTSRTKAIMVVHAFGHAADMDPIMAIAKRHGLKVIEDVAEALDATYKGQIVGTFGDAACYSFFANKIMTTGEGGMVLVRDAALDKALRIYRDHGMSRERKYVHDVSGFNYRMTNMQAAIGIAQLERLDEIQARRNVQDARYRARFNGHNKVTYRPVRSWCTLTHWLATVTLPEVGLREGLLERLSKNGVEGRPMVFPVHDAAPFQEYGSDSALPISANVSARSVHLPSGTALDDASVDRIADIVMRYAEEVG